MSHAGRFQSLQKIGEPGEQHLAVFAGAGANASVWVALHVPWTRTAVAPMQVWRD